MKLKTLNGFGVVVFAAAVANGAYANMAEEAQNEIDRVREREKCVAERTQRIQDTVEVVRIVGEITGKGVDERKLKATEIKSYAPDNYVRECGETALGKAIDEAVNPINWLWALGGNIGRDLDESVSPVTSFIMRSIIGGGASAQTRDQMIASGQWDPLDYPGRGIVPELPDKALSQGVGSALDIAAFVGSLSPDEKVQLVTSVLPKFAPGRELTEDMDGDTFGSTEDITSGIFGGLASVAQLFADPHGLMRSNLPEDDPLYKEAWGKTAARAGRDLDVDEARFTSSFSNGHVVQQNLQPSTTITITIPSAMTSPIEANTSLAQDRNKISLSATDEAVLDHVLHSALSSQLNSVSCETKGTITQVASVDLCEANGGLVHRTSEKGNLRSSKQAGLVSCQKGDQLLQVPSVDECEGSGGAVVAVK